MVNSVASMRGSAVGRLADIDAGRRAHLRGVSSRTATRTGCPRCRFRGHVEKPAARGCGMGRARSRSLSVSPQGLIPLPPDATDGTTCASPGAPFATFRMVDGLLTLGALVAVYALVGRGIAELGLRRPSRNVAIVAPAGGGCRSGCSGPWAAALGTVLRSSSDPDGRTHGDRAGNPLALSNGVMEEVIYRGAPPGVGGPHRRRGDGHRGPGLRLRARPRRQRLRGLAAPRRRADDRGRPGRGMDRRANRFPRDPDRAARRRGHPALLRQRVSMGQAATRPLAARMQDGRARQ